MNALLLSLPLIVASPGSALGRAQAAPELRATLAEAVASAEADSPALRSAQAEWKAAVSRSESRWSGRWPELTAESSYKFAGEVPSLSVIPGRTQSLGDHHNYSLGPSLSWTLWDQGARRDAWLAAVSAARARAEDVDAQRRQARLKTRLAYFQAQLALEQVRLLADSLKLAQSQYGDIEKRRQAGASSRLDSLSAHQEVLARLRQFRQARSDLAAALRDLYALTGKEPSEDLSLPLDGRTAPLPEDVEPASVLIALDPLEDSLKSLAAVEAGALDAGHPGVAALRESARSYKLSAGGTRAGLWPRLGFTGRTSLEYPNGPVLEAFHQNTVGVFASMPLFEFGRTRREAASFERQAEAADERAEAARRDLARDWRKAKDQLLGLKAQKTLCLQAVSEAREAADLTYESYKAGRVTFIEVQSANLREIEARVQAARIDAQALMQLASLASLAEKE
ncbi:MAG: TolC family protein [Elusimicrobia bacterium]|nr:TolC family protein [Elusimicrobiota bacterium]